MPTRLYSAQITAGGGAGGVFVARAGTQAIVNGASTVAVTFSSAMPSTNYAIDYAISNITDSQPIFLQGMVTTISTTGFTVTLNAAADTANYVLTYQVSAYV